ncbi:MAG: glycosyltransferase [Bacteroidota bacterium]
MKLNWFSPLPPDKSSIADYTLSLLPELTKYFDITLYTDSKGAGQSLKNQFSIRHYRPENIEWSTLNQSHLNIYNIGNNPLFHSSIWQVSRLSPGIVVLHDFTLHDFFTELFRSRAHGASEYFQVMKRIYGDQGEAAAKQFWNGQLPHEFMYENYPLTSLATENAVGIITHNSSAYDVLSHSDCLLGYTPLPYVDRLQKKKNNSAQHKKFSMDNPCRLILFGFLGANRRAESILQALSQIENKHKFHLDIFGEVQNSQHLLARINHYQLEKLVTVHGYVEDNELHNALSNADLALNLRYPSMGESSQSQLLIWNHCLPSIVTKVEWYKTLSDDCVLFVRPEHEIEDLIAHLEGFLQNSERYSFLGLTGRKLLESYHSPSGFIKFLIEYSSKIKPYRSLYVKNYLINRVTEKLNSLGSTALADKYLSKISADILSISFPHLENP